MDREVTFLDNNKTVIGVSFLLFFLLAAYVKSIAGLSLNPLNSDFGKFYESANLYCQGKNIYTRLYYKFNNKYQYSRKIGVPGNLNAPFFTVLTLPLGLVDYSLALYIWSTLSILAGLASAWLLAKIVMQYHSPPLDNLGSLSVFIGVIIFGYFPSFSNIIYGQLGLLLLLFFVAAWKCAREQKDHHAGILLGIIFSIKVFVGLFLIFFLLRRQWRICSWFMGTFIVCNLIAWSFFGLDTYLEYYKTLHFIKWYASSWNASIFGILARLFGANEGNVPLWEAPWLTPLLHKVGSFILLIGLGRLAKPVSTQKVYNPTTLRDFDIGFCYTLVAMLLISPLGWLYYFPILLIVFSTIFLDYQKASFSPSLYCLTVLAAFLSNLPRALAGPTYIKDAYFSIGWASFYCYALLLLTFILFKIRKTRNNKAHSISTNVMLLSMSIVLSPSIVSIIMYSINNPSNNALDYFGVIGYTH